MSDLRLPDRDETPLSESEVLQGVREGIVPPGPLACARAFADVLVIDRRRVEIVNFPATA